MLHEFGHALGNLHEHSSPDAKIPWNTEKVYRYYEKYGWSRAEVNKQVLLTYTEPEIDHLSTKGFDRISIMAYSIDRRLTDGGFSIPVNSMLSQSDKEGIAMAYPFPQTSARQRLFSRLSPSPKRTTVSPKEPETVVRKKRRLSFLN